MDSLDSFAWPDSGDAVDDTSPHSQTTDSRNSAETQPPPSATTTSSCSCDEPNAAAATATCTRPPGGRTKAPSPFSRIAARTASYSGIDPAAASRGLPSKWEKVGDVAIFKGARDDSLVARCGLHFARAAAEVIPNTRVVCLQSGGVGGELRVPSVAVLGPVLPAQTTTVHVENGIRYTLDITKVMFASGNGTERMRFSHIRADNEVVVDMFAGIGYFSIPLGKHGHPKCIYSIEKNKDSFQFLVANIELNSVSGVVTPILGDNREVGIEALGIADRILMGYIPTPSNFLPRAFQFANPSGCLVHYHYVCKQSEKEEMPQQHFVTACTGTPWQFQVENIVTVKSYAPQLYHFVADIKIHH
ncbi:class I SAM-dependent methyltransferase family protein [Pelomyxa schiedti]|nr:class I SAM-dependent methyltransferase family protein [Pelomyxa schiedti]